MAYDDLRSTLQKNLLMLNNTWPYKITPLIDDSFFTLFFPNYKNMDFNYINDFESFWIVGAKFIILLKTNIRLLINSLKN